MVPMNSPEDSLCHSAHSSSQSNDRVTAFFQKPYMRLRRAFVHLRLPGLVHGPLRAQVFHVREEADRQARRVCRAQRGGLLHRRAHHRAVQNIGLELHQQLVLHHAAIGAQHAQRTRRNPSPWPPPLRASGMPWPPAPRAPGGPCWNSASARRSRRAHCASSTARTVPKTPGRSRRRRCPPPCAPAFRSRDSCAISPRLSRIHCTSAPVMATLPSSA